MGGERKIYCGWEAEHVLFVSLLGCSLSISSCSMRYFGTEFGCERIILYNPEARYTDGLGPTCGGSHRLHSGRICSTSAWHCQRWWFAFAWMLSCSLAGTLRLASASAARHGEVVSESERKRWIVTNPRQFKAPSLGATLCM